MVKPWLILLGIELYDTKVQTDIQSSKQTYIRRPILDIQAELNIQSSVNTISLSLTCVGQILNIQRIIKHNEHLIMINHQRKRD